MALHVPCLCWELSLVLPLGNTATTWNQLKGYTRDNSQHGQWQYNARFASYFLTASAPIVRVFTLSQGNSLGALAMQPTLLGQAILAH